MTEEQRQIEHYKAVRSRLSANAIRPARSKPANWNAVARVVMRLPKPEELPALRAVDEFMTRREYCKRRARDFGMTFRQIIEGGRRKKFIRPKHLMMWEVKTQWPDTSFPMLARLFGVCDHTSALHAVTKIQGMKDRGEIE